MWLCFTHLSQLAGDVLSYKTTDGRKEIFIIVLLSSLLYLVMLFFEIMCSEIFAPVSHAYKFLSITRLIFVLSVTLDKYLFKWDI